MDLIDPGDREGNWQKIEVVPGFEPGLPERFDFDVIKIRSDNHYTIQPLMEDLGTLRGLCRVRAAQAREYGAAKSVAVVADEEGRSQRHMTNGRSYLEGLWLKEPPQVR